MEVSEEEWSLFLLATLYLDELMRSCGELMTYVLVSFWPSESMSEEHAACSYSRDV